MSLVALANHLAEKGRGDDKMLVHMTPGEVQGLQALALAHGGSLTVNPETGLVEAGWLKKLLPAIAGFALNFIAPGVGTAIGSALGMSGAVGTGLLVGGVTGLATGSLRQGIMAGLGAYGGASLAGGFQAAGSAAAGTPGVETITGSAAAQQQLAAANELAMATAGQPLTTAESQRLLYSTLSPAQKAMSGISALGTEAGRSGFMQGVGGTSGLMRAGTTAILGADAIPTKTQMPSGVRAPYPMRVRPMAVSYTGEIEQLPMFSAFGTPAPAPAPAPQEPPPAYNSGGIVALATGGATRDQVLQAYRDNPLAVLNPDEQAINYWMGQGLGSFNDVVNQTRAANPTLAQQIDTQRAGQLAAQQNIVADPQAAALAAAKSGIAAGLTNQQIAEQVNQQYGKNFTEQNVADFMASNNLTRPNAFATGADVVPAYLGVNAVAAGNAPGSIISTTAGPGYDYSAAALTDPTETAINDIYNRVLGRQAEQEGLNYWANAVRNKTLSLADVEGRIRQIGQDIGVSVDPTQLATPTAAQKTAQMGILKDPQAAAIAAAKFGLNRGYSDQQIADMINEQYGKSFSAQNVADFITANKLRYTPPDLFPGVVGATPGSAVTGTPAIDYTKAPTMEQVRSDYVKGGGRTDMPTITNIQPTDRTYTQNQAYALLEGYLKANPNAQYSEVVSFARGRGIPEMQAKAAYNEFRFSGLTGGSRQAYDYLMGRGAYPVNQVLPGGASLMRPYYEAAGISSGPGFFGRKTIPTTPSRSTATSTGSGADTSGLLKWENVITKEIRFGRPEDYRGDPEWRVVEDTTKKQASGGLSTLAGAAGGGQFNLGSYSDGGRLLRGPGDGVSDSIPATIGNKQPARLADGEFVIPARIVSELGNGSTEAGARKLYAMMDRVQRARAKTTGKGKVAKNSRADKHLPA
jgi:hypothetical protein